MIVPEQVAKIIVTLDGGSRWRGSGYRVGPTAVLTASHVVDGAVSVRVRFDDGLPGEWMTEAISCWTDPRSDLAVLTIAARGGEPPVAAARFGRIGARAAVLAVRAVGFPQFKLKTDDGDGATYRDSHQADGSVAVLSNRGEGTLEVTVPPPERDPDPAASPWEGMSGAAVWVGDRIVGVIAKHHRSDGLGRLAAARLDLALDELDPGRKGELRALLTLPEVLPDVIPPSAGEWVATAYQAQVRDIAPERLLDRAEELDELVGFCAGDQPYAWWQAGPWAGKSALMAWFVLHPPAGVDVVSFFVTARLAGQSDSDACTDALIEQLAALLGESPAGLLTVGARRGTMLRLLEDAARRSREAGRRLLLVIDGLDEDSGAGPGRVSIAALLPRRPPTEVRVLVASRPHPPIPEDVKVDHPLRTISPRKLDVSRHAQDVEHLAKHELNQLLAGAPLQRDILGLITAAGGGLTLGDLEELTERPPYEIEYLLGGICGRSLRTRTHTPGERVYLFTHETLRLTAERSFGKSLTPYRDCLHHWAEIYRQRHWPMDTPQYLLRSYPRLLASTSDLTRLVACATDQSRHDRMRSITGGDALALIEISTAQQLLLAQPDPDLTSLALIAVQREHLTERNAHIPTNLPVVWAKLGQPNRAEALAHSIPDPGSRSAALSQLAEAAAASGDHDRAKTLIAQITDPDWQATALGRFPEAMVASGDLEQPARLASEAKVLLTRIFDPDSWSTVLKHLENTVLAGPRWAKSVLIAESVLIEVTNRVMQATELDRLTKVAVASGDSDLAETFISQITDLAWRAPALSHLAEAVAASGDHDRAARLASEAETLIAQITNPAWRAPALSHLAEAVAASGDHDRAARLASEAEALVIHVTNLGFQAAALSQLALAAAASGNHDRAETLITQITDSNRRATALSLLAEAVAASGDHGRAETLITQIIDLDFQATALKQLALAAAVGGDHGRAARLSSEAKTLTTRLTNSLSGATMLNLLASAATTNGNHDRAARLASEAKTLIKVLVAQSFVPDSRAAALNRLAKVAAVSGDLDRAETLVMQITNLGTRERALSHLAEAAAVSGDLDRAVALIAQIGNPGTRARALSRLAVAIAKASKKISPVREHPHGRSPMVVRARHLLGEALATGSWTDVASSLACLDPPAVSALADELQVRWKLNGPADPQEDKQS
ncbi:MAG: trypsin-like peptidase domain-containing protein [Pseudonocardiaceae bacterium]